MAVTESRIIPLDIKRLFLTFLQAYFSTSYKYAWDYDVRKTKIIIADKNAVDIGIATKKPAIILARGPLSWAYATRAQSGLNTKSLTTFGPIPVQGTIPNADLFGRDVKTDILYGNVTFNVLSKNGIDAEIIANEVFIALTGNQDTLRKNGIRRFTSMTLGAENTLRADSETRLVGVPISVSFETQESIVHVERYNNLYARVSGNTTFEIFESADFTVTDEGTSLTLLTGPLPDGYNLVIDYRDAITLTSMLDIQLLPSSDPLVYSVPDGGKILGYYNMLNDIQQTIDIKEPY